MRTMNTKKPLKTEKSNVKKLKQDSNKLKNNSWKQRKHENLLSNKNISIQSTRILIRSTWTKNWTKNVKSIQSNKIEISYFICVRAVFALIFIEFFCFLSGNCAPSFIVIQYKSENFIAFFFCAFNIYLISFIRYYHKAMHVK